MIGSGSFLNKLQRSLFGRFKYCSDHLWIRYPLFRSLPDHCISLPIMIDPSLGSLLGVLLSDHLRLDISLNPYSFFNLWNPVGDLANPFQFQFLIGFASPVATTGYGVYGYRAPCGHWSWCGTGPGSAAEGVSWAKGDGSAIGGWGGGRREEWSEITDQMDGCFGNHFFAKINPKLSGLLRGHFVEKSLVFLGFFKNRNCPVLWSPRRASIQFIRWSWSSATFFFFLPWPSGELIWLFS